MKDTSNWRKTEVYRQDGMQQAMKSNKAPELVLAIPEVDKILDRLTLYIPLTRIFA